VGAEAPDGSASCQYNSPAFPCLFHKLSSLLLLLPPRGPPLQNSSHREITNEKMVLSAPLSVKCGRRKDDNNESLHWRKLEKGKKSASKKKHTNEESFGDDT
jgi:hypothetical protein